MVRSRRGGRITGETQPATGRSESRMGLTDSMVIFIHEVVQALPFAKEELEDYNTENLKEFIPLKSKIKYLPHS